MRDSEFGDLLFEQRLGKTSILFAVLFLLIGLIQTFLVTDSLLLRFLVGPFFVILGTGFLIYGIKQMGHNICVYENGIIDGNLRIPIQNIEVLAYYAFSVDYSGVLSGSEYRFEITGISNQGKKTLKFSSGNLGNGHHRIESMLYAITTAIKKNMAAFIQSKQSVQWGSHLTINHDSISNQKDQCLLFHEIKSMRLRGDTLRIRGDKINFEIKNYADNFWPGYLLIQELLPSAAND